MEEVLSLYVLETMFWRLISHSALPPCLILLPFLQIRLMELIHTELSQALERSSHIEFDYRKVMDARSHPSRHRHIGFPFLRYSRGDDEIFISAFAQLGDKPSDMTLRQLVLALRSLAMRFPKLAPILVITGAQRILHFPDGRSMFKVSTTNSSLTRRIRQCSRTFSLSETLSVLQFLCFLLYLLTHTCEFFLRSIAHPHLSQNMMHAEPPEQRLVSIILETSDPMWFGDMAPYSLPSNTDMYTMKSLDKDIARYQLVKNPSGNCFRIYLLDARGIRSTTSLALPAVARVLLDAITAPANC